MLTVFCFFSCSVSLFGFDSPDSPSSGRDGGRLRNSNQESCGLTNIPVRNTSPPTRIRIPARGRTEKNSGGKKIPNGITIRKGVANAIPMSLRTLPSQRENLCSCVTLCPKAANSYMKSVARLSTLSKLDYLFLGLREFLVSVRCYKNILF